MKELMAEAADEFDYEEDLDKADFKMNHFYHDDPIFDNESTTIGSSLDNVTSLFSGGNRRGRIFQKMDDDLNKNKARSTEELNKLIRNNSTIELGPPVKTTVEKNLLRSKAARWVVENRLGGELPWWAKETITKEVYFPQMKTSDKVFKSVIDNLLRENNPI